MIKYYLHVELTKKKQPPFHNKKCNENCWTTSGAKLVEYKNWINENIEIIDHAVIYENYLWDRQVYEHQSKRFTAYNESVTKKTLQLEQLELFSI